MAEGSDDAEEHLTEDNAMDLGSSDLELGADGGGGDIQEVGMRFLSIDIPAGAKIHSATIQFTADDDDTDAEDTSVLICGQLSPNPTTFTDADFDITSRPQTTSSVEWNDIPPWLVEGEVGPNQLTPDFSAVVREIIDQPDWAANNAMVVMLGPNPGGERTAESYDGGSLGAPLLSIDFTPNFELLSLSVDRGTGETILNNTAGQAVTMNSYQITSAAGSLDPAGWDSFEDQDLPGFPAGDGTGDGWEEGGSVDPSSIVEAYLQGSSTLSADAALQLGDLFAGGASEDEDLSFHYIVPGSGMQRGIVDYTGEYNPNPVILGDVNLDGEVNGLDVDPFVDVLLNGPYQIEADMNTDSVVNGLDVDPFVEAVVGGGVQAVPEPSTLALLVLGANTDQDAGGHFIGGTEEFFSGVMDNLEMFVLGTSTGADPEDFGTFDPQTDNQYIAGVMAGVPDGDVNMNGLLEPVADVDAFVAGWLNLNEVDGMQVGDLGSRALGDLNFDGITDLNDAFILHEALSAAGGGALTAAVPEPSTLMLLSLAAVVGLLWRRR